MFSLPATLKAAYTKIEGLKGRGLLVVLSLVFLIFVFIGLLSGYFINLVLNKNELKFLSPLTNAEESVNKKVTYEGKITYLNPSFNPGENISYVLTNGNGKDIILLRAKDQKLTIAENLYVKASGRLQKSKDGRKDILYVEEIIIKNAAD